MQNPDSAPPESWLEAELTSSYLIFTQIGQKAAWYWGCGLIGGMTRHVREYSSCRGGGCISTYIDCTWRLGVDLCAGFEWYPFHWASLGAEYDLTASHYWGDYPGIGVDFVPDRTWSIGPPEVRVLLGVFP